MNSVELELKVYIEDALKFLEEAIKEFERGLREGDNIKIRDSAEKAWNAVVQESNALILKFMGKVPSSHWERRKLLRELEKINPEIEKLNFRDRYSARERNLHELVFYEGIIDIEDIRIELEKCRKYIEDIRKLLGV